MCQAAGGAAANQRIVCPESCRLLADCVHWPGVAAGVGGIERLNAGLHRKLTLISASAGFGKTTLLNEWIHHLETWFLARPDPVAWLSLDEGGNETARFLAYLVAALQTVHESIGESALAALQFPQPPSIELLLTGLINEIAGATDPFVLVLDDFHVITDQQVNIALTLPKTTTNGRL